MFHVIQKILKYPRVTVKYPKGPIEASHIVGKPAIDTSLCKQCGQCAARCPSSAITPIGNTSQLGINYDQCIFCFLCQEICPSNAVIEMAEFELAQKSRTSLRVKSLLEKKEISSKEEQSDRAIAKNSSNLMDLQETNEELGHRLEKAILKKFGRSLQIREVDSGSCNGCDYEINSSGNPYNDIERFGVHFVASPRHADMLLVTGTATRNMEQALLKTYEATPAPKLVVAVGACACSGGIFQDSYATKNGIDSLIPVDVYIPGCPPRPRAIIYGILKAINQMK